MTDRGDLAGFVRDGVRLYNAGRYWEAHEALRRCVEEGAPVPPMEPTAGGGALSAAGNDTDTR